jgi:hypothetical protein
MAVQATWWYCRKDFGCNLKQHSQSFPHILPSYMMRCQAYTGNTSSVLLSTSHQTATLSGHTARIWNFQQAQRYNWVLFCGVVNTVNIECKLYVVVWCS